MAWLTFRKSLCKFLYNSWPGFIIASIVLPLIASIFFFILGVTGKPIIADAAYIAFTVGGSTFVLMVATFIGVAATPPRSIEHYAFHVRLPEP